MGSLKSEEELEQSGEESKQAILYVNGVRRVLPDGLAHLTLLEYLRGISKSIYLPDTFDSELGLSIFACLAANKVRENEIVSSTRLY